LSSGHGAELRLDPRLRAVALLVAGCFFMENLDGTIVLTAAPRIGRALHVQSTSIGLVIAAYLVTLAVLIPLGGWLAQRWGARPVFLAAIAIFTLSSLACALSSSFAELVVLRVMQGIGGAMMVPVGRLVVLARTAKADILRVMSVLVWPALMAPVVAPLAGGLILTDAGWRWLFLINVPLGVVALGFAWRLIDSPGFGGAPPPLDLAGVLLTCSGLGSATYVAYLLSQSTVAWTPTVVGAVAAVVLLTGGVRHLMRTDHPLINLRTLRAPTLRASIGGGSLFWTSISAVPFLLALMFRDLFGWSPVKSGALIPVRVRRQHRDQTRDHAAAAALRVSPGADRRHRGGSRDDGGMCAAARGDAAGGDRAGGDPQRRRAVDLSDLLRDDRLRRHRRRSDARRQHAAGDRPTAVGRPGAGAGGDRAQGGRTAGPAAAGAGGPADRLRRRVPAALRRGADRHRGGVAHPDGRRLLGDPSTRARMTEQPAAHLK
jgi:MFS family permease